ncbi:MAG: lysine--tRNA ligase, partial [Sphaerochaetaceae bacterium]|nr:lysine--tRNA ligase [Sphaerochaetaceae bacterium]
PEDFRWVLRGSEEPLIELSQEAIKGIKELHAVVEHLEEYDEKQLSEEIYAVAHRNEIDPPELFKAVYLVLIGKERGPKLAGFVITCGKEKILPILGRYL